MSLDKKYGIPAEVVSKMVKDGVISCSVARNYEIFDTFEAMRAANPQRSITDISNEVATKLHLQPELVKKVIWLVRKSL